MTPNKLIEKQEKYLTPENCRKLAAPRVDKTIWVKLSRDVKGRDIKYSKLQQMLATAGRAIAQSEFAIYCVLAILGHASADLAQL